MSAWLEEIRSHTVPTIAQALGLRLVTARSLAPCPACGAERRGTSDARGPIGLRADQRGWFCHRCGGKGDGIGLAALVVLGTQKPPKNEWSELHQVMASKGLCRADEERTTHEPAARRSLVREAGPTQANRPPRAEVERLWLRSLPVTDDAEAVDWIESRALDPITIADRDLSRVLLPDSPLPSWARLSGEPWTATSHRLLIPLVGATGEIESLHARALAPRDPNGRDKAASPAGAEVRGLVMADGLGRQLLTAGPPEWWPHDRVLVVEGVPDFLTWATWFGDAADDSPAILGVISGSWTDAIGARLPDGAKILVRTHDDVAGAKYAARILRTVGNRCTAFVGPYTC